MHTRQNIFFDYGARYYNPKVSQWLSVDPLAEKYVGFSPYNYTLNNPVMLVDVDGMGVEGEYDIVTNDDGTTTKRKISTLGDDEGIDFYHYRNGEYAGQTEILYHGKHANWMGSSNNIRGYALRQDDVNYADITREFLDGIGYEKSIFFGDHPMVKDLQLSYVAHLAREDFITSRKSKIKGNTEFGGSLTFLRAGVNMTEQMVGSAGYSVHTLGEDMVMIMVFDSKSRSSLYYHWPFIENRKRNKLMGRLENDSIIWYYDNRKANTYQTYIWIESIKSLKKRIEQYEIENGPID